MYDLVSLGEMMLRLSPPGHGRLRQAASLEVRLCGAQFNVAADLAALGRKTSFVSRLPASELGLLARNACLECGIDVSHIQMIPGSRLGTVYVEFPAEPRSCIHLYDRQGSAASTIRAGDFDWAAILRGARLAYTDGVFLGLSEHCREAALAFVAAARREGCGVCFDMNYRERIWGPAAARDGYNRILPSVDVLVTNRQVSQLLFECDNPDEEVARRYRDDFGCKTVCVTSRHMSGTLRGCWSSLVLHEGEILRSGLAQFEVVDRFGTGDAFFAGFLEGYLDGDIAFALEFGNALCALAHTIEGDVARLSKEEVLELLDRGHGQHLKR